MTWSLLDRYRYRGKHRGVFPYVVWVPRDLGGVHRGRYVEKPEWHPAPKPYLEWVGTVKISNVLAGLESPAFSIMEPFLDVSAVPVLSVEDIQQIHADIAESDRREREQEIREIVRDELASTPVYTALRFEDYGRWGDSDFDRADSSGLRIDVEVWDDRSVSCIECEQIMLERDSVWGFCSGCVELLDLES